MKRNKHPFEWTIEELDLEDTKRIKQLTKKEYSIYKWGLRTQPTNITKYLGIGFITGIIITILSIGIIK